MEDVEITDNVAFSDQIRGGAGGGARIVKGNVKMSRVVFRNNSAIIGGAVVFQSDCRVNITSCSFIDNTAQLNGGAFSADGQSANIFVTSTLLESNNAFEGEGGGMYLAGTSEVTMTKVNVRACFAGSNGGGASVRGESSLILENDVNIRECKATRGKGGGLLAAGDKVIVKGDISVEKNMARFGGGVCSMSRISLEGHFTSLLQDNVASKDGGGIFSFSSYAELIVGSAHRLVIRNNNAENDGGGICLKQGSQFSVKSPECSSSCANEMRGNGLCDHG